MKKISDSTIDALRGISPDELVLHGVIAEAPNHKGLFGYVCPMCGSGEGGNHSNGVGDGAGAFDRQNRFYCHACCNSANGGHKLSTIDLFALSRNLQHENFGEQCQQMCREFGLPSDFEEIELPRRTRQRSFKMTDSLKVDPPVNNSEKEMIQADLNADNQPLIEFVQSRRGAWRGLPLDILQKHGCKFNPTWTSPTSRLQKKFSTPTPRMLVPTGDSGYLARLTVNLDRYDERTQKYIHEKEHAGTKQLFNADALNADEPIFAVEGYIDSMSAESAGFKSVALGGRNRGDLLVKAVAKKEKKPKIIILFDGDKSGRETAPELFDMLIDVGCPCVIRFLTADESKLDCNQILVEQGLDALSDRLQSILDDSLAELDAVTRELEKEKNRQSDDDSPTDDASDNKISNDLLHFLFNGDASDLDFAYRLEQFCGDRVRWLTDDERWLVFGGGVWTRGSEKNSAVSHFGRELADIMSQYAHSKDERNLAAKFKSSKKIGASFTLLKSCYSIRITSEDLDRNPNLLCCLNCTVDLQTGKFYPHDSKLLITRQCRAEYHANAHSELVDKFFRDIQPDEMTRHGLLRWLAYNITAEVSEEKFAVWTGTSGGNGKSTLSATMLELLGTYGTTLSKNALCKSNRPIDGNAATLGLNSLENARFSIAEELSVDSELDSSLVKTLSGGDKFVLRRNYGEFRTIRPTAKLNFSGNFAPKLENIHDGGIRRRMINFGFNVQFGTADNPADDTLKKKLLSPESMSALLSILVREAVLWYRDGLIISQQMKQETARHLSQNDFVSDFVADNYQRDPKLSIKAKDFIDALKAEYPRETSRFKRADLIQLITKIDGVTYDTGNQNIRVFKGIGKPNG